MIDHIRIRHISEITKMVAPEHLTGETSDDIPSIIVVIDVIDNAVPMNIFTNLLIIFSLRPRSQTPPAYYFFFSL
jgi:hypothetical protein